MCGIFGVLPRDGSTPDDDRLGATAQLLQHRGPDAAGRFAAPGIGLVHSRLSLLDLSDRSNQPMWDEKRRYALVYNGEVYNFRELRAELEQLGAVFTTTGDTEVVLKALIQWSPEQVLPRLGGMFALAFYDRESGELLLARDRFGMKPLYIHEDSAQLAFASEIKAFSPWATLEAEPFSVVSYLLGHGGPTKGFTMYRGVRAVAPGDCVRIDKQGHVTTTSFFQLADFVDESRLESLRNLSAAQAVDRVDELMWSSVERHMFADSRIGAFCSGGVDSSLVMAMAARQHRDLAVFHANVVGSWSEHHAAAALADHLKLDLIKVDVHDQDFVDYMPDVMRQYEHPFTYLPMSAAFMLVSRLVKQHGVKGMLSGEGSDELFLGYPWMGRKRAMDAYTAGLARVRTLVRSIPAVGVLIWPHDGNRLEVVRDLLNRGEVSDDARANRARIGLLPPHQRDDSILASLNHMNHHLRALLHRNDCLGMEASIEARFPFLDHDLVSTALNMPTRFKLRFSPTLVDKAHPMVRDKWVIRKVADRYVPKKLSQRIKIGFWTTIFQRLRIQSSYFDDSPARELFSLSRRQMQAALESADQDLSVRLLHLDVWARVCLHQETREPIVAKLRDHVRIRPE